MPATQARPAQRKSKPIVRGKGSAAGTRQLSAPEHAYRELRRRILDNDLAPGESYSERQLEQVVGLNSATLRGALRRLAEEGLVELHSRHGVRIVPISLDDLREIFETMIALEPIAARRVALQDVTKADLDRLTATVRQMDAALLKDDLVAWAKADELFHARLIELCGNKRLRSLLTACMDQRHRARMLTLGARPLPVDSNRDHAAVVDAVRRHDADAAYALHQDHLARSSAMLISLLRRADTGHH
jgi:DNA-binding GntR family transcriptional regulator